MTTTNSNFNLSGYQLVSELYRDSKIVVYRARQIEGRSGAAMRPVVIKMLSSNYPTYQELVNFRHQYTITKNLSIPGVLRSYSLEEECTDPGRRGYALVMEDFGGTVLSQYRQTDRLDLNDILQIAIQLAATLQALGQERIVHKDIKPANILIHPVSKEVKLIDFSIASLLPWETTEILSPNLLEGTLAYLAPEQTGRMNRGIDYRSDFYALGITLYELLTGQLPFDTPEPLDLIHCHLAQTAIPVQEIAPAVPVVVSQIIAKLMAKNAEDRYQSALGLQYDLEKCRRAWQTTGTIDIFELGQQDISDRFVIPEKLYGRESEVKILLAAFDRVAAGSSELMLVAGFSGIGKTAVINEVHKPITRQQGYFIKGKFDQFNRNIPLSAFIRAFRDLIGQLLSESNAQLEQWQSQILSVVGENGQVLIEVIPELEQVIGHQPAVSPLTGTAAQNRFNWVFQKFIAVLAQAEHPLVVFLDDLQWADAGSLQLIKLLMESTGYLLILGAYRDNEVSPVHPLLVMVEQLQQAKKIVATIPLKALTFADTNCLIADTLNCAIDLATPLTTVISLKTQGNPFFTTQFLQSLHRDGQIKFNPLGYWECDMTQVQALSITADVVKFMATQLQKLPHATQNILKLAACVGNQFDLETLAIVADQSLLNTATALWPGLQAGLILPTSQIYKFWQLENKQPLTSEQNINLSYRFLHDRVQQAAYSLIPENQQQLTSLSIGRLLLANTPPLQRAARLFEIVNHFNLAIPLLIEQTEREMLAQLNSDAAEKARAANAYQAAASYAQIGTALLKAEGWHRCYALKLNLQEILAETAFLQGDFLAVPALAQVALERATTKLDRVKTYEIIIQSHTIQKQYREAIERGLEILHQLGLTLSPQPITFTLLRELAKTKMALWGKSDDQLLNLPETTDPTQTAPLRILDLLLTPSFYCSQNLSIVLLNTGIQLTLRHGNNPWVASFYSAYCVLLANLGDLKQSYRFGQIALTLADRSANLAIAAKVKSTVPWFSQPWQQHLRSILPILESSISAARESGNLSFIGMGAYLFILTQIYAGISLNEIIDKMPELTAVITQSKDESSIELLAIVRQGLQNLQITTSTPYQLVGADHYEKAMVAQWKKNNDNTPIVVLYTLKNWLAYLLEDLPAALYYADIHFPYDDKKLGVARVDIFAPLTRLAVYPDSDQWQQKELLSRVNGSLRQLSKCAELMPANFQHKYDLIQAEKCRVLGDFIAAMELFDRAIAGAKMHQYLQEEAITNELAAKFYLAWNKEKIAAAYLQEAYYCYTKWGATAKTDLLARKYPHLLAPVLQQQRPPEFNPLATLVTIASPLTRNISGSGVTQTLDLVAVIQSAQVLSSTIELEELIQALSQIILKNSGAETCLLALPNQQEEWQIRSVVTVHHSPAVPLTQPLTGSTEYPVNLIHWIKNTQTTLLADARQPLAVTDRYLQIHQPPSILALPIIKQGKVLGVLYLEHRHAPGIFTENTKIVISFLCTQAAIAIDNANLYQEARAATENALLQQSYLAALLDNIPHMAWFKDQDSRYITVNQSFSQLAGREPSALVGKTDLELWSLELAQQYRADDCQVMATDTRQLTNERIINHQGAERWLEVIKTPIKNSTGNITGIVGIALDITDRKRAEREQQFTQFAVENSADGIAWIRPDGSFAYGNKAICRMLGYSLAEFCTLHVWDIDDSPMMSSSAWPVHWRQLQTTKELSLESEHQGQDGHRHPVELSINYFEFAGEEYNFVQIRNIAHRQTMEKALRASEARYHQIVSNIPAALYQAELLPDGHYQLNYTSARFPELFELSATDVIADISVLFNLIVPEDRESFTQSLHNDPQGWMWEGRILTPTGNIKWIRGESRPLANSDGRLLWDGILLDITDRQQAQVDLRLTNERLELTVQELQRVTRLKDEFLATMSHELRTPLNAVLGMSEALQEQVFGDLNPRQIKSIQVIDRSGKHLLSLITDILDVSKISAGKLELEIKSVSLSILCQSSMAFIQQQAHNKQLQLELQLPSIPGQIEVDERRLRQVLINLLGNAVKFTPAGGHISLVVTRPQSDDGAHWLEFKVTDTGIGIAPADLGKLFQPFVQIDSNLNRQYEGTGLGLTLVKQIVELHGGNIQLHSEVGRGSCFTIRLPDAAWWAENTTLIDPSGSLESIAELSTKPARILIAEDNEANIDTLSSYLRAKGYQLNLARNGQEAIELVQKERPDLILMDIQMPGMDGLEAIIWIRQHLHLASIPIIALTALAMEGDRERCLAVGANEYLTKPVKLKQLNDVIQQFLVNSIDLGY